MNNELFFAQNKPILEDMKSITLMGNSPIGNNGSITSFVDQDGKTMNYGDVLSLMQSQFSSSGKVDKSPSVLLFLNLAGSSNLVPYAVLEYNSPVFVEYVFSGSQTYMNFYVVTFTPTQATYIKKTVTLG